MTRKFFILLFSIIFIFSCGDKKQQEKSADVPVSNAPKQEVKQYEFPPLTIDSSALRTVKIKDMQMRSPHIFVSIDDSTYYMTGDGGELWKSKDLAEWEGPYPYMQNSPANVVGTSPEVTATEMHYYRKRGEREGKYYTISTFKCNDKSVATYSGTEPFTTFQLYESNSIQGPYRPISDKDTMMNVNAICSDATFYPDEYNQPLVVYVRSHKQLGTASMQVILLTPELTRFYGEPYEMFNASDVKWSKNCPAFGNPALFETGTGIMGALFDSEIDGESVIGVAYSKSETYNKVDGPWTVDSKPLLKGGYGSAMIFRDLKNRFLMLAHKEEKRGEETIYRPVLFRINLDSDKLILNKQITY